MCLSCIDAFILEEVVRREALSDTVTSLVSDVRISFIHEMVRSAFVQNIHFSCLVCFLYCFSKYFVGFEIRYTKSTVFTSTKKMTTAGEILCPCPLVCNIQLSYWASMMAVNQS